MKLKQYYCNKCNFALPKYRTMLTNHVFITGKCPSCNNKLYDKNNNFLGILKKKVKQK